ncbi:hypothetical protein BGZ60DRAFT_545625 [Tricladium varicosporioides]|nr:hypothetical protein BGZ60DRAFT_545625 [Hymenoscyphus varicosporioides]
MLSLDICSVCSKAKLSIRLDAHPRYQPIKWLNEYLDQSRYFTCCREKVCKECFKKHLIEALRSRWWYKLGKLQWFPCPRNGCDETLGIRCEADLQICVERSLGIEADEYIKMYVKAVAFRQALQTLEPNPSDDTLKRAAEITQHLVNAKRMYSPFDPRFDVALVDETGCMPEFEPGTIYNAVADNNSSPIPLFLKFFRRQATPKECIACSKAMFEIDYGSIEAWKAMCDCFRGPWMWNILVFPTSEIQHCDHDFEICRVCTAEHIRNTLVSGGPSACENLTCPQCSRKFDHQEIHQLADAGTVAKYEKFLLQNFLSKEENFRWCLRPTCTSGQIYQKIPHNPKISCEVCQFEMCFKHQVPWHEEQTCIEYESQRDHGDPNFTKTQAWIRTNTKECPNPTCEVNIQKGEKCFHMTCSRCRHEFCWQCLAAWQDIRNRGKDGHNEGCFFRTSDVSAVEIRGETLEDALQARPV